MGHGEPNPIDSRKGPPPLPGVHVWRQTLRSTATSWLLEHRVTGVAVLPLSALIEMVTSALREVRGAAETIELRELALREIPLLQPCEFATLQLTLNGDHFRILRTEESGWELLAEGRVAVIPEGEHATVADSSPAGAPLQLYAEFANRGLQYGALFQVVKHVVCSEHELSCEIAPVAHGFEPFALEACVQAALCAQPRWFEQPAAQPLRCISIERLSLRAADLREATRCHVLRTPDGSGRVCVSVLDAAGRVLLAAERLAVAAYSAEARSLLEQARPQSRPKDPPPLDFLPALQGPAADQVATGDARAGSWVIRPVRRAGQPLRLLVFPFSGGNAASCLFWARRLPEHVELCAVELPGHGFRRHEPAIEHFGQLVDALDRHLRSEREQPYALFGHSMGALLSFELARRWSHDGGRPPTHLFASGMPAPQWFGTESLRLALAENRLMQHLLSWALVAPSACGDELLREGMPLPADLHALASWRYQDGPRLGCSITALCGEEDILTPRARTEAWQEQTEARFRLVTFPGGHFYFDRERAPLFRVIADDLVEVPPHGLQLFS